MATTHTRNPTPFSKHRGDFKTEQPTTPKNEAQSDPEGKPECDIETNGKTQVSKNFATLCIRSGVTLLKEPVVRKRRGKSRSANHADIKAGLFVKPVQIGPRATATPDYEVDILIAATIAGKSDDEIRALVQKLHAARKEAL
jgi:prophage regulatory protein